MKLRLLVEQSTFASLTALTFMPDCSAGTASGSCNLYGLLHLLYVIAAVLGIILIAVVLFAVHAWRRSKDLDLTKR